MQFVALSPQRPQACSFPGVIPEIDIWRAANLMLKRYGEKALEQSATRAEDLGLMAITTARRAGAGLPPPSHNSRTRYRRDPCTDRNGPVTLVPAPSP